MVWPLKIGHTENQTYIRLGGVPMVTRTRRKYDSDFKRQTVELADATDKADAVLERELGLYLGAIRTWRRELSEAGTQAFPGKGHRPAADEEVQRLKRELAIVTQERDILKKAVAIFSTPSKPGTGS
jgi:transposase